MDDRHFIRFDVLYRILIGLSADAGEGYCTVHVATAYYESDGVVHDVDVVDTHKRKKIVHPSGIEYAITHAKDAVLLGMAEQADTNVSFVDSLNSIYNNIMRSFDEDYNRVRNMINSYRTDSDVRGRNIDRKA